MAWSKSRIAGLIVLAAVASTACSCPGAHEPPPDVITPRQMMARMRVYKVEEDIVGKAQKGEGEAVTKFFDLTSGQCLRHDPPEQIYHDQMWNPGKSYIPHEQYYLDGFFCMKDYIWYYLYRSPDLKSEVLLGPYSMTMTPTPQDESPGAGPTPYD